MKKDIIGIKFNRLKALRKNHRGRHGLTFYVFLCECGNTKVLCGTDVATGKTKSCGCLRHLPRLHPGEAAFNSLYLSYANGAKSRELMFCLSPEEFRSLTKLPCVYCGVKPSKIWKGSGRVSSPYTYNGIDRVDNQKGYITGNVASCCEICNTAKRSLSLEHFNAWIKRLVNFHTESERTSLGVNLCQHI